MAYTKTNWVNSPSIESPINSNNLNNIENGIETNDINISELSDGWISTSGIYASPTTITVDSGATSKYSKGDKLKLTQTKVKYFYIIEVADTLLTITGGSDYTLTDAAITNMFYSHMSNPINFPDWFNYTPTITGFTGTITIPTAKFKIAGKSCFIFIESILGTSNATTITFTLPVIPLEASSLVSWCAVRDNGTLQTISGHIFAPGGGVNYMVAYKQFFQVPFTTSGSKGCWFPTFSFEYV